MTQPTLFPPPPIECDITLTPEAPARRFGASRKPFVSYKPAGVNQIWFNCTITWTDWSGKVVNPTGRVFHATGVTVRHFGHKTVEMSGGTLPEPVRRKIGSKEFLVTCDGQTIINEHTKLDAQKRIVAP